MTTMATAERHESVIPNLELIVNNIVNASSSDDLYDGEGMDIFLKDPDPTDSNELKALRNLHTVARMCFAMRVPEPSMKLLQVQVRQLESDIRQLDEHDQARQLILDQYNQVLARRIAKDAGTTSEEYGNSLFWQIKIESDDQKEVNS